jgi:hypothetical protein
MADKDCPGDLPPGDRGGNFGAFFVRAIERENDDCPQGPF